MQPKLVFRKGYFLLAVVLFLAEIFIAKFVHDRFVRPYAGDFLVVILLYCFFRSFLNIPVFPLALAVLALAYALETMQYFHLLQHLGWQHSRLAQLILGVAFSWIDMLSYTIGVLVVLGAEKLRLR